MSGRCFANIQECEASSGCQSEFVMASTDSQVVTKPGANVEWFAALRPAGVDSLFGATFPVQLVDLDRTKGSGKCYSSFKQLLRGQPSNSYEC